MSLANWRYRFVPGAVCQRVHLPSVFREWHRGHLLRMPLEFVEVDGKLLTQLELERLNLWLSADGGWRLSALPYWDAYAALCDVLVGRVVDVVPCGPNGAGRWTSRATLEEFRRDGRKSA